MDTTTLADSFWDHKKNATEKAGFGSADDLESHLQHVVDIYALENVYDSSSNIGVMYGRVIDRATELSKFHMAGKVHSRTREEHIPSLAKEIESMNCN